EGAPVIVPIANITRSNDPGKCTAKVDYTTTATDCNLQSLTFSPASGSLFPLGTSTVTITATDTVGTTATSTFTVTVVDTEKPVIAPVANITTPTDAGLCSAIVTYNLNVTDNCPGVTYTAVPASGSTFAKGTTTVTVTATDAAGNVTTMTFTV